MPKPVAAFAALVLLFAAGSIQAQDSTHTFGPSASPNAPNTAHSARLARLRHYPWNGFSAWAGGALQTRTASNNERFEGSMRIVGIQVSRDIVRSERGSISYVGEILPIMLLRAGPPDSRAPDTLHKSYDPRELARFRFYDSYGFGLAPFGAEGRLHFSAKTSALVHVTAGGLMFNHVVPYGAATKANFTVSPGIALQRDISSRTRIAFGYTLHHVSNASFGRANPGINSHMLYLRLSQLRREALPK